MLWQQFLEQRSNVVGNKMQREVRRMAWRPPLALASRTFPSTIVMDASHISRPTFPLQVQKIVMDFLKENKDGGKVSGPPSTRRVCVAHRTLTPLTPSALPCAPAQVVNERGEMRLEDLPPPLVNEIRSTQRRYDARAAHRLERHRSSLPFLPLRELREALPFLYPSIPCHPVYPQVPGRARRDGRIT